LAFSRRQRLNPKPANLNQVIRETEGMIRDALGNKHRMVIRLAPRLESVRIDAAQFERVLLNLAVNAHDAMRHRGTFAIETKNEHVRQSRGGHVGIPPGRYVRLTVSDTGLGMTPQIKQRAFEPFYSTKPPGQGTGLGLAVVHGIVQQSNGHIRVESTPGKGACFSIYLPCASRPLPLARRRGKR
jgi:signal transduction histidine kinase